MPPETAHYFAMFWLQLISKTPIVSRIWVNKNKHLLTKKINFLGIEFPNEIGLAAGFDKNAKWLGALQMLGFGHVEIGTVTPKPQPGNPKPRLFRLAKDNALINRMGFNNDGIDVVVKRLKNRPAGLIVGGNIGKNKITPNQEAANDYYVCFERIYDVVDYIVINVSSPNTPGLRALQDKDFLIELFSELNARRSQKEKWKPVLLKIAPDLNQELIEEIVMVVKTAQIDGLIISNTTIDRNNLISNPIEIQSIGAGGLSGQPVLEKSTTVLKHFRNKLGNLYPIIAVGGIFDKKDLELKKSAGGNLFQVYTGFIYRGPNIVANLLDS